MALSSVSVVLNSLLLTRWRPVNLDSSNITKADISF
jgi:cation transport ATPase